LSLSTYLSGAGVSVVKKIFSAHLGLFSVITAVKRFSPFYRDSPLATRHSQIASTLDIPSTANDPSMA
jgi:hypothetical protein